MKINSRFIIEAGEELARMQARMAAQASIAPVGPVKPEPTKKRFKGLFTTPVPPTEKAKKATKEQRTNYPPRLYRSDKGRPHKSRPTRVERTCCPVCNGDGDIPTIGGKIRARRMEAGLSQKALGAMMGINDGHVSALELGEKAWTKKRLAQFESIMQKLETEGAQ